jgi:predicted small lipoprotein YifL
MLRQFRILAVASVVLAFAGCGIKGPLVLPPPAAPPAAAPAPAAPDTDPAKQTPAPAERKP